MDILECSGMT